jgi:NadR type nicotinamide-nucleotide adenylyltransferase
MSASPLKIAITGPESTGKSVLSIQLAEHYGTVFVPEYARRYLDQLGRPYTKDDILVIARGQLQSEQEFLQKAKGFLFCDTELIVAKIWSEVKYGSCDEWILENMIRNRYDLYLLCNIDLPWENDPQREHPHLRQYLFDLYEKELTGRTVPFVVISGSGEQRMMNAVKGIEAFFQGNVRLSH